MPTTIPADVPIKVVFAQTKAAAIALKQTVVAILPDTNDNFNDFGRRYYAYVCVVKNGTASDSMPLRLMFEGRARTRAVLDELFETHGPTVPIEVVEPVYCSLLPDPNFYRRFTLSLGFHAAVSALRRMGDAVVARIEGNDPTRLRLVESEDFHLGILRTENAYEAFRRGGRYLRPVEPTTSPDAASSFAMGARLPSASNPYLLRFDFERSAFFQDRAAALIGRNGVGKTQLLRCLVEGLQSGEYAQPTTHRCAFRKLPTPSRVLVFSTTPSDPYPRVMPPWQGLDYEYFNMSARYEHGADPLLPSLIAIKRNGRDEEFLIDGRARSRMHLLQASLRTINIWSGLHVPLKPANGENYFSSAKIENGRRYFPFSEQLNEQRNLLLIQELDWDAPVLIFDPFGRARELSSGETAMFRFVAMAVAAIEPASLLLFDEPETHLHPNFVSDFMGLLQDLLAATLSAAVIATHSAYVVREVPRKRVNILTLEEGRIQIDQPRMQTFGASIDTLSEFVFGDSNLRHRFQDELKVWVNEVGREMGLAAIIREYGSELNPEALSFIARILNERDDGTRETPEQ